MKEAFHGIAVAGAQAQGSLLIWDGIRPFFLFGEFAGDARQAGAAHSPNGAGPGYEVQAERGRPAAQSAERTGGEDELRPAEISVVENWTEELKRLVPPK